MVNQINKIKVQTLKIKSFFKTAGERILVHLASLMLGIGLEKSLDPFFNEQGLSSSLTGFSVYIGLICLFPRGNPRRTDWYIPSISGFLVIFFLTIFALPWQLAIFWGGVQSWLLRSIISRGNARWEWATLPWIMIAAGVLFSDLGKLYPLTFIIPSILTVTVLAYFSYYFINKIKLTPARRKLLLEEAHRIESFILSKALPLPFEDPLKELANNSVLLSRALPSIDDSMIIPLATLNLISNRLALLVASDVPRWKDEGKRLYRAIENLNDDFAHRLRSFDIAALDKEEEKEALEDKDPRKEVVDAFYKMGTELVHKKTRVPEHLHPLLDSLRLSTRNILDTMRVDPFDYESGERFLRRYLPAVHRVLDNYIRLQEGRDMGFEEVEQVLNNTEELLKRMDEAFKKEYSVLLRNDTMDLRAELSALDALMRLDGR